MAEVTPARPDDASAVVPPRTCEKCRKAYSLDQFSQDLDGLECVCKRCLGVMGYQV